MQIYFFGDFMTDVKIKAKMLIKGSTLRLFSLYAISFILRRGVFLLWLCCLVEFFKSGIIDGYLEKYNALLVYGVVCFDVVFISLVVLLFISALRLGEQFLYFIKASGGKGRGGLLFHFFTFKKSFRAMFFYMYVNSLKLFWLAYYLIPCSVCYSLAYYLYNNGSLLPVVFYTIIAGGSVLLSYCIFMWRVTLARYNAAPYYLCLNNKISPKAAVEKSITFTDGFLRDSVLFDGSFMGWLLSCGVVLPLVYVVPYFKISKALFVIESLSRRAYPELKAGCSLK